MIKYKSGYKYILAERYSIDLPIRVRVQHDFMSLDLNGKLTIERGYVWDGASGPTWDDKHNMRGSLVHDALYQMMREGLLSQNYYHLANEIFRIILLEDGMSRIRAWLYYRGVETSIARVSSTPAGRRRIETAP